MKPRIRYESIHSDRIHSLVYRGGFEVPLAATISHVQRSSYFLLANVLITLPLKLSGL
jgi:hypothetical protein